MDTRYFPVVALALSLFAANAVAQTDGDIDGDGRVGASDLSYLKAAFLTSDTRADLNGDGAVNFADLGLFRAAYDRGRGVPTRVGGTPGMTLLPSFAATPPGGEVVLELWMDFTAEPTLGGGTDITWRPDFLTLESWEPVPLGDPDLSAPGVVNDGLISGFAFGAFEGLSGPALVGVLTFRAVTEFGLQPVPVGLSENQGVVGGFVSAVTFVPMDVDFTGADVQIGPLSDIATQPRVVVFRGVPVDGQATLQFFVLNRGDEPFDIGVIGGFNDLQPPFAIAGDGCSGLTLMPTDACGLLLSFTPTETGLFNDSFNIQSTDPLTPNFIVAVSGSVLPPPRAEIRVIPPLVDFGQMAPGDTATRDFRAFSRGSIPLAIGAVGGADPLEGPFVLTADACSQQVFDTDCVMTASFSPTADGIFVDTLDIPSNDPTTPVVTVDFVGSTVPIVLEPARLDFGELLVGASLSKFLRVRNRGESDIEIQSVGTIDDLAAPFSLSSDDCSGAIVLPGQSCLVIIRYDATEPGPATDSLDFVFATPSATATALVSASAVAGVPDISVEPATLELVATPVVGSDFASVQVSNPGDGALGIGDVGAINPVEAPFSISADGCSQQELPPGTNCVVTAEFAPQMRGEFSDSFDIPSNDPDEPSVTIELRGRTPVVDVRVVSANPGGAVCRNLTRGQNVPFSLNGERSFECVDRGMLADPGDLIQVSISGFVNGGGLDTGGTVAGLSLAEANCQNVTTGQQATFLPEREDLWNCEAAGVTLLPGQVVRMIVTGEVQ